MSTSAFNFFLVQQGTTDADEKRTNVLNELYQTEKSYLNVLELISQDFYSALVDHISSDDTELLFSAVKVIYDVNRHHIVLLNYYFIDRLCIQCIVLCWKDSRNVLNFQKLILLGTFWKLKEIC